MILDVFFIGDPGDAQFGETISSLRAHVHLRVMPKIDDAVRCVTGRGAYPAVVFLGQSRRGQFAQGDVERLVRAAPLARVVVLAGSWCEGESRSGRPIAGVHRLAWHEAPRVIEGELEALSAGRASDWSWPAGSGAGAVPSGIVSRNQHRPLVVAFGASAVTAESIALALHEAGFKTAIVEPLRPNPVFGADAMVWDVSADTERANAEWLTLRAGFAGLPVVALFGFPRSQDVVRLRTMGVATVLGKPYQVAHLADAVESAAAGRPSRFPRDIAA
jgi:hypothetical protein